MTYKRKLKIAQIAPIIERIPPKKYGGTERVVHALTEELVQRGHEVTLFASGDSITSAKLVSVCPTSLREVNAEDLYGLNSVKLLQIGTAYNMQHQFNIIHDHNNHTSILAAQYASVPVVMTYHGAFTTASTKLFEKLSNPYFVAISESQAKSAPNVSFFAVVHNGLVMNDYPVSNTHDNYLLYVGRISQIKGVHFAIQVSKELRIPLIIAAKLDTASLNDIKYFHQFIEPELEKNSIHWLGEVTEEERNRLMSKALCMLHPATWEEPFGLTIIEAMACGCPVVAFNRGSIPEIVIDGKTGYVVEDVAGMKKAIRKIDNVSRSTCRQYALTTFTAETMADKYEELYYRILKQGIFYDNNLLQNGSKLEKI